MNKLYKLGILAISLIITGCSNANEKNKGNASQIPTLPVGVIEVSQGTIPITLEFSGQTTSDMDVILKAKVTGTIEEQFFKAGASVKKGDKLYLIDQAKYKAAYDTALANLKVSEANYKNASTDFERSKKLYEQNAISQKEYDASKAAYESANATVLASKANLQTAKIDLDYSVVTAPFSGVLGDTLKDVGSYVSPSDGELVRLTKLDPIFVQFAISDIDKLNISQKLQDKEWEQLNSLVTMKYEGTTYNGTLSFIDNVIDETSGTINAKAKFDNNNTAIKPGAFTKVNVYGFYQKNGFKIPQVAILQDLVNPFVYTVQDGKVAKNPIKIVSQDATSAIISSGLKQGDQLIVDNFKKIKVGQPVKPVPMDKGGK